MNIYVGNLAWEVTEAELQKAFENFGQITSVSIIKDKFTGQSRGFGFVEMANRAEAEAAIAGLNGRELRGRPLKVNEARPPERREDRGGSRGGGGGRSGDRDRDRDRGGRGGDRGDRGGRDGGRRRP